MPLELLPISLAEANNFVELHHRHHQAVVGHKFSLAAVRDGELVGVAIVGRPVSRLRDDGLTLEVTRLCTDGSRNACSFLYGAAARAAFALGYRRIGTYTLPDEGGASLRAAGWQLVGPRGGGSWSRGSRPRTDRHPTQPKLLWELVKLGHHTLKVDNS
jgi:hypothetical protein